MEIKRLITAGIKVVVTNVRFAGGKIVHGNRLSYSPMACLSFSDEIAHSSRSVFRIGKRMRTRGRCRFSVQESGELIIGEDVFFNSGCQINCRSKIEIGSGCEFGPNVLVYDHDHDFRAPGGIKAKSFKYDSVSIGKNCWIGANTVILRGTVLGDNCVVGAGCVLKGEYPKGATIVQKRETSVF